MSGYSWSLLQLLSAASFLPLPLAGKVAPPEERGGWGKLPHRFSIYGNAPTPALPRKREKERSAVVVSSEDKPMHGVALPWPDAASVVSDDHGFQPNYIPLRQ